MSTDLLSIFIWWLTILAIGVAAFPLSSYLFKNFVDRGYIFSKVLGILLVSYIVFLGGLSKIVPFTTMTVTVVLILFGAGMYAFARKFKFQILLKNYLNIIVLEELLFLTTLIFWSYIRAHQPNINGLEKFMDYGFVNSIIRSTYFPPADMWFTPLPINYYYFGHLVTAVLTKLSTLQTNSTYNLMIATLFAFTFTCAFSLVINLFQTHKERIVKSAYIAAFLAAFLMSMGGSLHMIYSFFTPYNTDKPVPFWPAHNTTSTKSGTKTLVKSHQELKYSPSTYPNSYWYPNATRFIPYTIHEFPLYSFVVSDLHGHVLDIPFVFLTLAILLTFIKAKVSTLPTIALLSLILAVMYMTNAWDGLIYGLLTGIVLLCISLRAPPAQTAQAKTLSRKEKLKNFFLRLQESLDAPAFGLRALIVAFGFIIFTLPFNLHFKPFVSGIGIVCAPEFLTEIKLPTKDSSITSVPGKIGPFLFEKDHCQKTPFWQLTILYGFFYFFVIAFLIYYFKKKSEKNPEEFFVLLLIGMATLLIIIPEFVYAKDIYPDHYRANTMFKLVYQSFMLLSLVSGYTAIRIIKSSRNFLLYFIVITLCSMVLIYPFFAIQSYYENLKTYRGLDGIKYLSTQRPTDYEAILWIQKNITGQPVILEAQGDSYTDYARISSNTGIPTVLGWTVHEWLWRGTYDIPAPRIEEIRQLYELADEKATLKLLQKHSVQYVYIGDLEREKYPNLVEKKFKKLGKVVYKNSSVTIYKITSF